MFVNPQATTKITIYYQEKKRGGVLVRLNLEDLSSEEAAKYKAANFSLRHLNWKEQNDVFRTSRKTNNLADEVLDWEAYKQNRLLKMLVVWDAKDSTGKAIPLTPENVLRMHPAIPEAILISYDRGDEEETAVPETPEVKAPAVPVEPPKPA